MVLWFHGPVFILGFTGSERIWRLAFLRVLPTVLMPMIWFGLRRETPFREPPPETLVDQPEFTSLGRSASGESRVLLLLPDVCSPSAGAGPARPAPTL